MRHTTDGASVARTPRVSRQLKMSKKLGKVKGIYNSLGQVTHPKSYLLPYFILILIILNLPLISNPWWLCLPRCQSTNLLIAGSNSTPSKTFFQSSV